MTTTEERILVVPREALFSGGHLRGFSDDPALVARYLDRVAARGRFVPRWPAEEQESLKQIVPYGLVLHGTDLFLFRRGKKGAEAGLRGRWSIGLGGHVNPGDGAKVGADMLRQALLRELAEEVALEAPRPELWGVLNDDEDPVGRRHFGLVYRVWVAAPAAFSREPGKIQGEFKSLEVALACRGEMETWSRIVMEALA